jgi:hypothetical protein
MAFRRREADLRPVVAAEHVKARPVDRRRCRRRRGGGGAGQVGYPLPAPIGVVSVRVLQVSAFDLPASPDDEVRATSQPELAVE